MSETIEKRLKDYKGFEVWKVTDNKGTRKEEVTYMLNDSEGNNINCFQTLKELKQFADNYKQKGGGYYEQSQGNQRKHFLSQEKPLRSLLFST